jgi:hypothetical protein
VTVELTTQGVIVEGESAATSATTAGDWTAADLAAVKAAIRDGVKRVRYAGPPEREVEYQSLDALRKLKAEMIRALTDAPSHRYATFSKGFRRTRRSFRYG